MASAEPLQVRVRGGLGGDAGDAAELHELGLELVEVGVEIVERGLQRCRSAGPSGSSGRVRERDHRMRRGRTASLEQIRGRRIDGCAESAKPLRGTICGHRMELSQVGKYKIIDKIGQGAMGEVFRAHDPVLGRDVAIKVVTGKLSDDEGARQRFQREAQAAAQLNHPNIITVYDFGEEQRHGLHGHGAARGQRPARAARPGQARARSRTSSRSWSRSSTGSPSPTRRASCTATSSPATSTCCRTARSRSWTSASRGARRTRPRPASIMGTPYYMAPEQAQGERATARSDIFSLGAMFYEMLAGQAPVHRPHDPGGALRGSRAPSPRSSGS